MSAVDRTREVNRAVLHFSEPPESTLAPGEWERGKRLLGKMHRALQDYPQHQEQLQQMVADLRKHDAAFAAAYTFLETSRRRVSCFWDDSSAFIVREMRDRGRAA